MTNLWSYPHYNSFDDWIRLYVILYPFGGLAVLELMYFIANLFGEKLVFVKKKRGFIHKLIDRGEILFIALIFFSPLLELFFDIPSFISYMIWMIYIWAALATIKLRYHIRHWGHYLSIFIVTFLLSVFLHEIPNVGVFEWKYGVAPFLNYQILGIRLWVIIGWYFLVLMMLRFWLFFALKKIQK